ncbi:GNAT family N-acetyltransferase [Chroococcidiopsis sp. SAG 2025]|uniref:GNAT family N-acetyltransferase n=1 Tax=Chroococcidiopsis sp. SAG 2025 TaxID=171389 RepID=UPI0029374A12|nr:GNAT family N-acetyltransferase [Chroococcidiopsis sp. SAG 2025]
MSRYSDSNDIHIRLANMEDVEAIAILSHQLGYSVSTIAIEQRLDQILSDSNHIIYVATGLDDRAIAWIHAYTYHSLLTNFHAEIGGLVVTESDRGAGIGRKLLDQAESWAKTRGCQSLLVRSNIVRSAAHRFYQKCGYNQVKTSLVFHKVLSYGDL